MPREDGPQPPPRTVDLDLTGTQDVHEESTADLGEDVRTPTQTLEPAVSSDAIPSSTSTCTGDTDTAPARPLSRPKSGPVIAPGAILCDRFILERQIGQGGTAVVYREPIGAR